MVRGFMVSAVLLAAPALVTARPQSRQPAAASSSSSSVEATATKPKKIWTNDNLGDVTGTISVVGEPRRAAASSSSTPSAKPGQSKSAAAKSSVDSVDPKRLAQVREQLQKLQAGIDNLDKQIEELTGLSKGDSKNTGGARSPTPIRTTARAWMIKSNSCKPSETNFRRRWMACSMQREGAALNPGSCAERRRRPRHVCGAHSGEE